MKTTLPPFLPSFLFAALLLAFGCLGCSSDWSSLKVEGVAYQDLFELTAHVITSEGFSLKKIDPNAGLLTTDWNYSKITDTGRFPIRRRVEARIDPEDEGGYLISVRIDQEANWEGYGLTDPRLSDSWDEYGYDEETASLILKKIDIQVREFGPSEDFKNRFRKAEKLKGKIPKVLDSSGR